MTTAIETRKTSAITTGNAKRFWLLVGNALDSVKEAAAVYVAMVDEDAAMARKAVQDAAPVKVPTGWLETIENIGRGHLVAQAWFLPPGDVRYLRRLPVSAQDEVMSKGVDVAVGNGDSQRMKLTDMPHEIRRQVFTLDGIRDLAAQRAYMTVAAKAPVNTTPTAPFTVRTLKTGERVIHVLRDLSIDELLDALNVLRKG